MSAGIPDRLTQLRARWQGDRSSRIFLQLAEEYRHLGRVQEALEVLDAGLQEHPGYLSALVAKGRCLLELGDAAGARVVLERVVQQDPTQMVANKLLVRAYLETNEPERARQRLELYSLLNDGDPEIEELQRRVVAMSRPPRASDGPRSEESAERSRMERAETPESFAAGPLDSRAGMAGSDLFHLDPPARGFEPPASSSAGEVFDLGPPPALVALPAEPEVATASAMPPQSDELGQPADGQTHSAEVEPQPPPGPPETPETLAPPGWLAPPAPLAPLARGQGNGAEPFPDMAPEHSRQLYLASLEMEQLFSFGGTAAAAEPLPAAASAEGAPAAADAESTAPPEPGLQAGRAEDLADSGERHHPAAVGLEAAAALGTVTLGELYLRQGHLDEAERIFRQVAEREPDHAAANDALAEIEQRRAEFQPPASPELPGSSAFQTSQELEGLPAPPATAPNPRITASQLLAGFSATGAPAASRKAYLLQSYLTRLRQARSPHVP